MAKIDMVIREQDHARLSVILEELREESNARFVFLLDRNGQGISQTGSIDSDVDTAALASLTAGSVAATEGLAKLTGEQGFSSLLHEGNKESIHVTLIADRVVLLLIFDEHSSLGLVRLRVDQQAPRVGTVVGEIMQRANSPGALGPASMPLNDITEEDIDALFG